MWCVTRDLELDFHISRGVTVVGVRLAHQQWEAASGGLARTCATSLQLASLGHPGLPSRASAIPTVAVVRKTGECSTPQGRIFRFHPRSEAVQRSGPMSNGTTAPLQAHDLLFWSSTLGLGVSRNSKDQGPRVLGPTQGLKPQSP